MPTREIKIKIKTKSLISVNNIKENWTATETDSLQKGKSAATP